MILELDLISIALAAAIFILFAVLGSAIERTSHMIWPIDFYSVIMYVTSAAFIIILAFTYTIPWPLVAVAIIAYLVGYLLTSRRKHINIFYVEAKTDDMGAPYIVPYKHDGEWYIQKQSFKEHMKFVLAGIRTPLDTNWNLENTKVLTVGDPYIPIPRKKVIICEDFSENSYEIIKKKGIKIKQYHARAIVSPEGMAKWTELIFALEAHKKDIQMVRNTKIKWMQTKHQSDTRAMYQTAELLTSMFEATPQEQLNKTIKEQKSREEIKEEIPKSLRDRMFRRDKDGRK